VKGTAPGRGEYHEVFIGLSNIVLEESWVLSVDALLRQLIVALDLVLTPTHSDHHPPASGEAYCYRRGRLVVDSDTAVILRRSTQPPAVDSTGEPDYGHIDVFRRATDMGEDVWELGGDWGEALVRQPRVHVQLDIAPNR
jgi:hypothetical protein